MRATTAERTINELRLIFAEHGLPEQLVSGNGPLFTSAELSNFRRKNGVKNTLVPPDHTASNVPVESTVRLVKEALEKQVLEGTKGMSVKHRLPNFVIKYRCTLHSATGRTPAELKIMRQLWTRLTSRVNKWSKSFFMTLKKWKGHLEWTSPLDSVILPAGIRQGPRSEVPGVLVKSMVSGASGKLDKTRSCGSHYCNCQWRGHNRFHCLVRAREPVAGFIKHVWTWTRNRSSSSCGKYTSGAWIRSPSL